jgi:antitoxin component YwqK of YwqJK toxin-antitoxin module
MAMDIMAHQARFLINICVLLYCFTFFSCNNVPVSTTPKPVHTLYNRKVNRDLVIDFKIINGLLMQADTAFSGTIFSFFSGTKDTAEVSSYNGGKEDGEWRKYYPSKKLKEKRYFKDGSKTGEYLVWWENGNKQLQYFFEADEYQGVCKEWNQAGFLNKIMTYKKGHEEGHQQWWYDDGKIKANYVIIDGRRYGLLGTKNCVNVSDSIFKK